MKVIPCRFRVEVRGECCARWQNHRPCNTVGCCQLCSAPRLGQPARWRLARRRPPTRLLRPPATPWSRAPSRPHRRSPKSTARRVERARSRASNGKALTRAARRSDVRATRSVAVVPGIAGRSGPRSAAARRTARTRRRTPRSRGMTLHRMRHRSTRATAGSALWIEPRNEREPRVTSHVACEASITSDSRLLRDVVRLCFAV